MEEALALVLPPTSRGTAPGWGVPPLLGTPGFRLLPSQLASTFHHKDNGISADGESRGKPPPAGSTCLTQPAPPLSAHRGWGQGRNPFLGSFLPHFPFLCDSVTFTPHTLKEASCLWPQTSLSHGGGGG